MKFNWKQATLSQLYEIIHHDQHCNPRYKLEAKAEIQRRQQAKQANIKWRAQGRNYG